MDSHRAQLVRWPFEKYKENIRTKESLCNEWKSPRIKTFVMHRLPLNDVKSLRVFVVCAAGPWSNDRTKNVAFIVFLHFYFLLFFYRFLFHSSFGFVLLLASVTSFQLTLLALRLWLNKSDSLVAFSVCYLAHYNPEWMRIHFGSFSL